jgi:hypothetical protein
VTTSPASELLVSPQSAALMLGLGVSDIYRLLATGFLSTGSRYYVTAQSVLDYANERRAS